MNQRHLVAPSEGDSRGVPSSFRQVSEDGHSFLPGWRREQMEEPNTGWESSLRAENACFQVYPFHGKITRGFIFYVANFSSDHTHDQHDIILKI